jgi:hypothetical protein
MADGIASNRGVVVVCRLVWIVCMCLWLGRRLRYLVWRMCLVLGVGRISYCRVVLWAIVVTP